MGGSDSGPTNASTSANLTALTVADAPSSSANETRDREPGKIGTVTIGVITVIPEEFAQAQEMLGLRAEIEDSPYYVAQLRAPHHYEVVLMQLAGRGNIKASGGARRLMEDLRPRYLLLVGVAGGFRDRDNTQLGDVVVPDFVDGYEMRKIVQGRNRRRMEAYDHPSHRLRYQIAQNALNGTAWLTRVKPERRPADHGSSPRAFCGNLISGEKILGDDEDAYQKMILSEFDNAVAVDMESLGMATAVYEMRGTRHYNPEYLVIRGISDLVNEPGNNETRQRWRGYAAHTAAAFAAEVVERLLRLG